MKENGFRFDFDQDEGARNPFDGGDSGALLSQDEVDLLLGGGNDEVKLHERYDFLVQNMIHGEQYDRLLKLHTAAAGMIGRDISGHFRDMDIKVLSSDIFRWEEFFHSISEESWFIQIENRTLPWLLMQMSASDFHKTEKALENAGEQESAKKVFSNHVIYHLLRVWHGLHIRLDNKVGWHHYLLDSMGPYNEERVYQVVFGMNAGGQEVCFSVLYPVFELSDLLRMNIRRMGKPPLHLNHATATDAHPAAVNEGESLHVEICWEVAESELEELCSGSLIPLDQQPEDNWLLFQGDKVIASGALYNRKGHWSIVLGELGGDSEACQAPGLCRLTPGHCQMSKKEVAALVAGDEVVLNQDSRFGEMLFLLPDGTSAPCRIRCREGAYYVEVLEVVDKRLQVR